MLKADGKEIKSLCIASARYIKDCAGLQIISKKEPNGEGYFYSLGYIKANDPNIEIREIGGVINPLYINDLSYSRMEVA